MFDFIIECTRLFPFNQRGSGDFSYRNVGAGFTLLWYLLDGQLGIIGD